MGARLASDQSKRTVAKRLGESTCSMHQLVIRAGGVALIFVRKPSHQLGK